MVLDMFIWSMKMPSLALLAILRIPSLDALGLIACLALLTAYAAFFFSMATLTTALILLMARTASAETRKLGTLARRADENDSRVDRLKSGPTWGCCVISSSPTWLLIMMGVPIKMILRWTLSVKYIWVLPGVFNI